MYSARAVTLISDTNRACYLLTYFEEIRIEKLGAEQQKCKHLHLDTVQSL